ncbi:MerR family transcriptional regulator [Cellulosimicrobium cellulans]|nr:MerR family transcriptional regulator [Cellulosimicrobium cellulans]
MTAGAVRVTLGRVTTERAPRRVADALTVGEAAAAVGVTVRTLHHWDAVGLARPSERTAAGYRLYSPADVARLRRVVAYRELDVALEDIPGLLDAPGDDAVDALRRHRALLGERIARMERTARALDRLVEARERGLLLTPAEQVALFGATWDPAWPAEARERWGDTPQWAQYAERSAERTLDDWQDLADDVATLEADLAAACREGVEPSSARGLALAERHRASIGAHFDCTPARHVCLARRFVEDDGFRAHYDGLAPGLAAWLRAAIEANARSRGVDPATASWD